MKPGSGIKVEFLLLSMNISGENYCKRTFSNILRGLDVKKFFLGQALRLQFCNEVLMKKTFLAHTFRAISAEMYKAKASSL